MQARAGRARRGGRPGQRPRRRRPRDSGGAEKDRRGRSPREPCQGARAFSWRLLPTSLRRAEEHHGHRTNSAAASTCCRGTPTSGDHISGSSQGVSLPARTALCAHATPAMPSSQPLWRCPRPSTPGPQEGSLDPVWASAWGSCPPQGALRGVP